MSQEAIIKEIRSSAKAGIDLCDNMLKRTNLLSDLVQNQLDQESRSPEKPSHDKNP
jgi:hypothetical protein